MNRLIVSIIILAAISAGCIVSVFVVDNITQDMYDTIDIIEQAYEDEDSEKCVSAAEELSRQWESFMYYGILVNDLGHAVEITGSVAEINSLAQSNDEELYTACDRAQAQIKLFRQMQQPSFWKIL